MAYKHDELRQRTKSLALRVFKLCDSLQRNGSGGRVLSNQLLRSATSVAANYRAVGRARSKAEFISKIGIVVEEMDETVFWLEFLVETTLVKADRMQELTREANELLAIFAASQHTARGRNR